MTAGTLALGFDVVVHGLAVAVRPVDHFLGMTVDEPVDVTLVGSAARPVRSVAGGERHADGTYRFIDVPAGDYDIDVTSKSGNWLLLTATTATVPAAGATPVDVELWPTPRALRVAPGFTVIRGVLAGVNTTGLRVEIGGAPDNFTGHFARTDDDSEFVAVVPRAIAATENGVHELVTRVESGARTITSISIAGGAPVLGDIFELAAGRTWRVTVQLAP